MTTSDGGAPVYEGMVQSLIDELGRLPGVGPKSAQRIAFYLLAADTTDVRRLPGAGRGDGEGPVLPGLRQRGRGRGVPDLPDPRRDQNVICVVEEPKDVAAIEKIREFRGRYHVLGGRSARSTGSARRTCGSGN